MASLPGTVELLTLFGDPTRIRLLALLSDEELSVAELTTITDLPQSRVSTHLGKLRSAGFLQDRRNGSSTYYSFNGQTNSQIQDIWKILGKSVQDDILERDKQRCDLTLRSRNHTTAWPDAVAGQMERHYSPGRTWEATTRGLLGFIGECDVLDVGCGDGAMAQLLAPYVRQVTCLDRSSKVITAATKRLSACTNARFVVGDMHDMPFASASFNHVLHFHAIPYSENPQTTINECFRVLRPHGTLHLVTLHSHGYSEIATTYSHIHNGHSVDEVRAWLKKSGFQIRQCQITSRERRKPYFEVITAFACRPQIES